MKPTLSFTPHDRVFFTAAFTSLAYFSVVFHRVGYIFAPHAPVV